MEQYLESYAEVLLTKCLKIKKGEPLYIQAPMERIDFVRIVAKKAYELGVKDIGFNLSDAYIKHEQLKNLSYEELKKIPWWTGHKISEYASKNAAVLSLCCEYPSLNNDISSELLNKLSKSIYKEAQKYYDKALKNELSWCIAAVAVQDWADKLFPNDENSLEKLWKTILDICLITQDDPKKALDDKIAISSKRAQKINNLNIKYFKYTNSLGTDLTIEMPKSYIFHNIEMQLQDRRVVLPNLPSEEIYSSPYKYGTNGIVYASKPLVHNGKIINNFWLKFKDGKVIDYDALEGYEELKQIINQCENSNYLGEIAFVGYDSPISNTNMLFYTTLYDENASCHLALGQSFADALENGVNLSVEQLETKGLNQSNIHVDFMIGTSDLKIIGIDRNNQEIVIFKDGNFVI